LIDDEAEKMLNMGAIDKSHHEDNELILKTFSFKEKKMVT
jgi:hypothetical protein